MFENNDEPLSTDQQKLMMECMTPSLEWLENNAPDHVYETMYSLHKHALYLQSVGLHLQTLLYDKSGDDHSTLETKDRLIDVQRSLIEELEDELDAKRVELNNKNEQLLKYINVLLKNNDLLSECYAKIERLQNQ